ncbi:GntR family transcriptional regulator [Deinococcus metalli]|uniref:GntR family transcriptional regulator n=1 Tax=Deinococcus metalli TaxID=1141878 RepID=A0A7W8NTN4_9DEIO|nr:GntR family transcriptional regulator [Deinococcus metalli]MBB5378382.1 GntR family transcriptional regulator [Deinococcus metalli]GHF59319.1 GntR family transcriptional regulator [Deinococcus metalli]
MSRDAALTDALRSALDPAGPLPPYAQLRAALAQAIERGVLRPGDPLPTVRALAADLGLAVNTVAKTYAALKHDGLTENRAGAGTTVARTAWTGGLHEREAVERWRQHTRDLLAAGVQPAALRGALDDVLALDSGARPDRDGQEERL